ncbi:MULTISPECIES: alpha/beta hydrolase [Acidithrix]|uniref:Alpha/beta hydrolase family protein n=1 Tax=Acidithrix ferrooxidans TaxID=1280514 RepID=A0A0D8HM92_9ACTN|nr:MULTISPECIES: alpha/beta hydrolase [Acidithrix]KJF18877.1 alpha/beta hydrolase family protein [Acidithrix ferrooxidans]CAG4921466.1 unnamed protein product [Acidithrix sp. C25]
MSRYDEIKITKVAGSDNASILVEDFGGEGHNLLIAHATGFNARMYLPLAIALRSKFHCFGINARYHGGSSGGDSLNVDWGTFANDIERTIEVLGGDSWAGFGHSYGGAALILAEANSPGLFKRLALFEPVVPIEGNSSKPDYSNHLSVLTKRRRRHFGTRREAHSNFESKFPMSSFDQTCIDLYLETGLKRTLDAQLELTCPREIESEIYAWASCNQAYSNLPKIEIPMLFISGETTDAFDLNYMERLREKAKRSEVEMALAMSHFGPFEKPEVVAKMITNWFDLQETN